jgi:hypothetical protein
MLFVLVMLILPTLGNATIEIGKKYQIVNGPWFGCVDEKQMETIISYANDGDQVAFQKAIEEGILDGTIEYFTEGQVVTVKEDHSWWNSLIQVRPQGETQSYWTLEKAVGGE